MKNEIMKKKNKKYKYLEDNRKALENIDMDAVVRKILRTPEEEGNINNYFLNRYDEIKFREAAAAINEAIAIRRHHEWKENQIKQNQKTKSHLH